MRRDSRRIVAAASAAVFAMAACNRGDNQVAATLDTDTVTPAVDTAPQTVATTVAVLLTGENVVALLDTAYAAATTHAQLARQKASTQELRTYAELVEARHRAARQELRQAYAQLGISPALPEEDVLGLQRAATEELNRLSGTAFDRAYVDHSIRIHEDLVEEVEEAIEDARNANAVALLRAQRQKLNSELQALQRLRPRS